VIVRILGEGQYEVDESNQAHLDELDNVLVKAVDGRDEAAFGPALRALAAEVRRVGQVLADDAFVPSELVVPFADSSLEETRRLLAEAGRLDEG
jgi:hypothetical protein